MNQESGINNNNHNMSYEVEPHKIQQIEQEYNTGTKKLTKLILGTGILLIIGTLILEIYFPLTPPTRAIDILPGMGSRKIADILKREGMIRSKWLFITYVTIRGASSDLKPGRYYFTPAIVNIVDDLVRGGTIERNIVIPEGWTAKEIGEYFEKENVLSRVEFERLVGAEGLIYFRTRFEFLRNVSESAGLEGYLFPDTYRIFVGSSAEEIIVKMLENFGKKVAPELRQEVFRQKKTLYEIVTMASLIEKEVAADEDRAIVSGILWKRLKIGIPLQVDATIAYIKRQMVNGTLRMANNHKISIDDTKIDSPYNTYKYRGLPKGPISNPGLSAIRAAIYPEESPYFYYLSAPDGRTIFSKTFEEHNTAKAKYLRN